MLSFMTSWGSKLKDSLKLLAKQRVMLSMKSVQKVSKSAS
jgi:hypothetical protein